MQPSTPVWKRKGAAEPALALVAPPVGAGGRASAGTRGAALTQLANPDARHMLLIAHPAWGLLGSNSSLAIARAPAFAEGRGVRAVWVGRRVSLARVIGSGDPHGERLLGPSGGLAVHEEGEAVPSFLGRAAEER
jgi:hypothetical protein